MASYYTVPAASKDSPQTAALDMSRNAVVFTSTSAIDNQEYYTWLREQQGRANWILYRIALNHR